MWVLPEEKIMRILPEAMRNLFRRRFTRKYPDEKPIIPEGFRGKIEHSREKCIYCGMCARYCPSHAISVDPKEKTWRVDYGRCIFCQQCEEVCRDMVKANAIKMGKEYELADTKKRFSFGHRGSKAKK